ncbi:MAG: hypothetical protein ABI910_04455 [Gemmatimonadota bacterium]
MDENSAAAASVSQPGIIFTVNDSGNDPMLFAFDTTGADRGRWRLEGARNRDWETVAVGRCEARGEQWCVFIGDVGDNSLSRPSVTIYRVAEPAPLARGGEGVLTPDVLRARYPDSPHNVETMVVAPDGALLLLTKDVMRSASGGLRPTMMYRLATGAWRAGAAAAAGAPAAAELVDSLPIVPRSRPGGQVTDAALSPDGHVLAVRTNAQLYAFVVDSATARPLHDRAPAVCDLSALHQRQGEGVGFVRWDGTIGRFALTSEGKREPLWLVNCPLPVR